MFSLRLAYAFALVPFVALAGCGTKQTPFQPGNGGPVIDMSIHLIDGGKADGGNGDGGSQVAVLDMAGFNCVGCPQVTINAPTATTEVQYDTLPVTATITSGNSIIEASSVQLLITPPGGSILTSKMSLTGTANVYAGMIDIGAIPSGPSTFTVECTDAMGRKGSATGTYIHDHGPVITFLQPTAATAHGSINVELMIDDALHPITDPSKVSAYIHSPNDVMLTQEMGASPLRMQGTVLFSKFSPPLDGTQIINATAVNSHGTVGKASTQFIVDNSGPVIAINNPAPGTFQGGVLEIKATITDISGVDDASVLAVLGNDPAHNSVPLVRTTVGGNAFHGFFDLRSLGRGYVLPEISVTANDLLGNSNQLGEEIIVDNTPPKMTMNSKLHVYLWKVNSSNQVECSHPFSPLGRETGSPPEAAYDGAIMEQLIGLRARVEDRGNTAPGLLVSRFSGLNDQSVYMFAVHDDGNTPLAVDTDGDGVCDNVNPALVPSPSAMTQQQALSLQLLSLAGTSYGNANYMSYAGPGTPAPVPSACGVYGDSSVTTPPTSLCPLGNTALTVVLPWVDPAGAIWSIPPINPGPKGSTCVGLQLDSLNTLPSGPTCVVTVATDKVGNTNVTAPLHICIDKTGNSNGATTDMAGSPCANWDVNTPPTTCTGVWDKVQKMIVPGTCTPEPTFVDGELRDSTLAP